MSATVEILRSLLLDRPGDGLAKRYAKNVLFLCPLVVGVSTFIFGGVHQFGLRFLIGLVIAVSASSFCHLSVSALLTLRRAFARWDGRPVPLPPSRGLRLLYSLLGVFPGTYVGFRLAAAFFPQLAQWSVLRDLGDYGVGVLFGTLILGVVALAELQRDTEEREKDARLHLAQAQLSALTAQMNPHLLFNALNTIAALIPADPRKAEEMTVWLADLYRGVLGASQEVEHALEREMELCRSYLSVEKARFGARLRVEIGELPSPDLARVKIPVLILQPLVENAVRHGLAPKADGGVVRLGVRADEKTIEIGLEDDGVGFGKSSSRPGTGTGITNCRERLRLRYGKAARLDILSLPGGGTRAAMIFPRRPS